MSASKTKTATKVNLASSTLANTLNVISPTDKSDCQCDCGCCDQQSTTLCITFNTTALQNLVNLIPKFQITNNSTRCCSVCGHAAHTGECPDSNCNCK